MKNVAGMDKYHDTYVLRFVENSSGSQKFTGTDTHTDNTQMLRQKRNTISLIFFFQNKVG
jgi:hypothetical protein